MRKPNKKTRLKHYKMALKEYETNPSACGMCIVIGDICYGGFFSVPWTYFEELVKYYPELTEPKGYKDFSKERIKILEKAIKKLES